VNMPDVGADYAVAEEDCLDGVLGFEVVELGEEHAVARFPVADRVKQRFGLIHGGAYAALAEMLATEATVAVVYPDGFAAMGISNDTSFLRGARGEWITATARRRHRGRTTWVWEIDHTDDAGRLCAISRVTIAVRPR
jgi:1,4-dihydroxy-2-naphthoyl-CoA hydrolase